jgi:hypothetical protein
LSSFLDKVQEQEQEQEKEQGHCSSMRRALLPDAPSIASSMVSICLRFIALGDTGNLLAVPKARGKLSII